MARSSRLLPSGWEPMANFGVDLEWPGGDGQQRATLYIIGLKPCGTCSLQPAGISFDRGDGVLSLRTRSALESDGSH